MAPSGVMAASQCGPWMGPRPTDGSGTTLYMLGRPTRHRLPSARRARSWADGRCSQGERLRPPGAEAAMGAALSEGARDIELMPRLAFPPHLSRRSRVTFEDRVTTDGPASSQS